MAIANTLMHPDLLRDIKCVVFDCDGVLIDSYEANMVYYGMIKEKLGLPPLTDDEKSFVHANTHKHAIEYISPEGRFDDAWEVVRDVDSTSLMHYLKRSDGVREFLWWLRDAGFMLAVNTSRTDTMDAILQYMDLEGFFFPVITSTKVAKPKPHPEGMFMIMNALGVEAREIAYIGDTYVDESTAKNSGVRFWAYGDQTLDAEVHINDFWTIKAAMQHHYKGCGQAF